MENKEKMYVLFVILVSTITPFIASILMFIETKYFRIFNYIIFLGSLIIFFILTKNVIIPYLIPHLLKKDIFGYDMYAKGTKDEKVKVPESLGLGPATIYSVALMIYYAYFRLLNQ